MKMKSVRIILSSSLFAVVLLWAGWNLLKWHSAATLLESVGLMPRSPEFYTGRWFKNGMVPAQISGKWGFIDKSGQIVIEPKFAEAFEFSEGVASVLVGGFNDPNSKWGYVDTLGRFVISPQ